MQDPAKILLPVDFSARSRGAARYAKVLAQRFHSEVILLHALTPPQVEAGSLEMGGAMLPEIYAGQAARVQAELAEFLQAELSGVAARCLTAEGDAARCTVELARNEGVRLIVMPTHGYGPFRRFILGSCTAKVLHDADCPVFTGAHMEEVPAGQSLEVRNVVCGLDLGPHSAATLAWAWWFAQCFRAHLTVIHATTALLDTTGDAASLWQMQAREAAEEELLRLQLECSAKAEILIEAGDPSHVVCSAAARQNADVLVIGRGSAAGVFGRLRTNSYTIIRESPCPVVSV